MENKNKSQVSKYLPQDIEKKWRHVWNENNMYQFVYDEKKETYYNLVELPYPSGDLHLGHWFSFVTADTHARYKKMAGWNVFFPNGFDAFGLPAENAAIKRGLDPKEWTMNNIATMRKQFDTMGTMIDWSHEAITCLPEYYRWNQWIFLRMLEKGIAYRGKALGNWCPVDQTVLANEHVEAGKCWRCGSEVVQKEIEQWFLKITDYADQLLWPDDPSVDWPKSVREGQNNWIGKSTGVLLTFTIQDHKDTVEVFTTALDTVFGVSFMVISPEHPLVTKITTDEHRDEVNHYVENASKKSELERMAEGKEKTGVFTGSYVINPFNDEKVPVWVSDYVIMGYGTGAVMGVPAHDERDHAFAQKFKLPITPVIKPVSVGNGLKPFPILGKDGFWNYGEIKTKFKTTSILFNSGSFSGLSSEAAKAKMEEWIEKKNIGKKKVQYHLHDWSISRQRYWGTPIPVIHCDNCGSVPVPDDQLPVTLPDGVDFTPKGEPPLATVKEWLNVSCPKCGGEAKRDAETMDTFFDSSWYYYRYVSPHYTKEPFDQSLVEKVMPVDVYYGGAEHTLGHTLYARFFTKFFKEIGLVSFDEFAKKRVQHGVILGPDGNRMSKSKGNVVNPDDLVKEYGTDTVRTYLCFMMPYEATAPWSPEGIWGSFRFLKRVWDLSSRVIANEVKQSSNHEQIATSTWSPRNDVHLSSEDKNWMHKTIKKVGEDINAMKFNTAVAAMMTWLNYIETKTSISKEEYKNLLLLLSPFAPHMTEELWQSLTPTPFPQEEGQREKGNSSIHLQQWPIYDEKYLIEDEVSIIVQVNGKMRETITVHSSQVLVQSHVEEEAKKSDKVQKYIDRKEVRKIIYVPGKIINFVV